MISYRKVDKSVYAKVIKKINIDEATGCWYWVGTKMRKYGLVKFNKIGIRVHRVMYSIFNGLIPEGLHVCHKCDNPACCNPEHLFLGTVKDNVRDCISKGRFKFNLPLKRLSGENHPRAKLTNYQIGLIRKDKRVQREIALDYGVAQTQISNIKSGKTWKHVIDSPE
jgi:hypothetical protein